MDSMIWIIGILVFVGIAITALYMARNRRGRQLREPLGPESELGERRAAAGAPIERARRSDALQIPSLTPARRQALVNQWQQVQAGFVADPAATLDEAHRLLSTVMRAQGYPTSRFEEEIELVSVHHPATVQHYRAAHELAEERARGRHATEELRQAMIHYRALFEDLLNLGVQHDQRTAAAAEARHEA